MGRIEVGLDVGVRPNDDAVSALVVGHGQQRRLDRAKRLLPTAAVGVIAKLGDVKRLSLVARVVGGRRIQVAAIKTFDDKTKAASAIESERTNRRDNVAFIGESL